MIELGPGLAAVLGGLTGGAASFGATWIDGKLRRDAERESRRESERNAAIADRNRANADLIAAAQGLIAAASVPRWEDVDRAALREMHSRVGDAAARAALLGPSARTAKSVLHFADALVGELRNYYDMPTLQKDTSKLAKACDHLSSNVSDHLEACAPSGITP